MRPQHNAGRGIIRLAVLLGLLCIVCPLWRGARADDGYSEDAVKAAYLYRFAGYVKWPRDRSARAPFTIDVIGDGSVASVLRRLLPNHPVNGRMARVRVIRRIADLGDAQMLYIGNEYRGDIHAAIASIARRPVLVVTDEERGLDDGSVINFVEVDRRVRFEVSLTAAGRAGLEISSELLSVAARVEGGHLRSRTNCVRGRITGEWGLACPVQVSSQRADRGRGAMR
jgi:hypothetical protein